MADYILEVGQNFGGSIPVLSFMIDRICKMGPRYIKLQAYDCSRLFKGDEEFYQHSMQAELTFAQMDYAAALVKACSAKYGTKTQLLMSPFDGVRLSWWVEVFTKYWTREEAPMIPVKLGSRVAADLELLNCIRGFNREHLFRPVYGIISHGMDNLAKEEYDKFFTKHDHLWCKANYPAYYTEDDWKAIETGLKDGTFQGVSDHSIGEDALTHIARIAPHALLERHVTWIKPAKDRFEAHKLKHAGKLLGNMTWEEWMQYDKFHHGPDHICSSYLDDIEAFMAGKKYQ